MIIATASLFSDSISYLLLHNKQASLKTNGGAKTCIINNKIISEDFIYINSPHNNMHAFVKTDLKRKCAFSNAKHEQCHVCRLANI